MIKGDNMQLDENFVRAVARVESNETAFKDGYPIVRFEKHIFKKYAPLLLYHEVENIKGTGLSAFNEACKVDKHITLLSTSFGMFQIMGFNYNDLNYPTVEDFVEEMCKGAEQQKEAFIRFVTKNKLITAINARDIDTFSKRYNGPNYKKWGYDVKLRKALHDIDMEKNKS